MLLYLMRGVGEGALRGSRRSFGRRAGFVYVKLMSGSPEVPTASDKDVAEQPRRCARIAGPSDNVRALLYDQCCSYLTLSNQHVDGVGLHGVSIRI